MRRTRRSPVIEVQTVNYLGEDDIVRYEDVYRRDFEFSSFCGDLNEPQY